MKYLIFSDCHGSKSRVEKVLEVFEVEKCDRMILLGDVLYHGPRNPLPEGHDPKGVVALLNGYADRIIAIRGNCDTEVDQMVLEFPCLAEYAIIVEEGRTLFATHGHHYGPQQLPKLAQCSVFLYGHTHLWELREEGGIILCNPGSIALPKEDRPATYGILDGLSLSIYTLDGEKLAEKALQ
ncbi:MAG: phosphodiesterase [Cellulosilyticaceae bacterium]